LKFVTPNQCHRGEDVQIRQQRRQVYLQAREHYPLRWSRDICNWEIPKLGDFKPGVAQPAAC